MERIAGHRLTLRVSRYLMKLNDRHPTQQQPRPCQSSTASYPDSRTIRTSAGLSLTLFSIDLQNKTDKTTPPRTYLSATSWQLTRLRRALSEPLGHVRLYVNARDENNNDTVMSDTCKPLPTIVKYRRVSHRRRDSHSALPCTPRQALCHGSSAY